MTFREQLRQKASRFFFASTGFFVVVAPIILAVGPGLSARVTLSLFLLFLLPLVPIYRYFRCPKCGGGMASLIGYFGPLAFLAKPIRYCPCCGVSLDDAAQP